MIEVLINIAIAILIGIVLRDIKTVIIFLLIYVPLRTYSGGWHTDKLWKCTIVSNVLIVAAVIISNLLSRFEFVIYLVPLYLICIIWIVFISPSDTEAKLLSDREKNIYKNKVILISVIHVILFNVFIIFKFYQIAIIIEYVYWIQSIMLLVNIIHKKRIITRS